MPGGVAHVAVDDLVGVGDVLGEREGAVYLAGPCGCRPDVGDGGLDVGCECIGRHLRDFGGVGGDGAHHAGPRQGQGSRMADEAARG